ncbi:MAG: hypothetical protein JSS67_11040 [Bacteroidetes bacterium]|nr:hypothetical protein [Bacteroidota bacterium]
MDNGKKLLWKYASLGSQILIGLGLAVVAGYYLDRWINIGFPLFVWVAPLCFLIVIFVKIINDTSQK